MQYASKGKTLPAAVRIRTIARIGVLTSAAVTLSATAADAQGLPYGSLSFTNGNVCGGGSAIWFPPTTGYPNGYTFVLVNGHWVYAPFYKDPSCFGSPTQTPQTTPPTTTATGDDLFVSANDDTGNDQNADAPQTPNDPTGDGPNYAPTYPNTPANDLTVTPEPSTIVLLASGLAGLGVAVRRRRTRSQRQTG